MSTKVYTQQELQEVLNHYHEVYCGIYKRSTTKENRLLAFQSFSLIYDVARKLGITLDNH